MGKSGKYISPYIIRQLFVLLLVLLTGGLILSEMRPYLSGILGAITVYVILRNPFKKLLSKGWNVKFTALVMMSVSVVAILIPLVGLGFMMGGKVEQAVSNSEAVLKAVKEQTARLENSLGVDMASGIDTGAITTWLSNNLQNLAGGTFTTIIAVTVMYFLLYFMLINRSEMQASLFEYIPIKESNLKTIAKETHSKVRANALGIPLVALGQGFVGLIGFLIFGIEDPFFWAAVVTIGSMVPLWVVPWELFLFSFWPSPTVRCFKRGAF